MRSNPKDKLCDKMNYLKDPYKRYGEKLKINKNRTSWGEEGLVMASSHEIFKWVIYWQKKFSGWEQAPVVFQPFYTPNEKLHNFLGVIIQLWKQLETQQNWKIIIYHIKICKIILKAQLSLNKWNFPFR